MQLLKEEKIHCTVLRPPNPTILRGQCGVFGVISRKFRYLKPYLNERKSVFMRYLKVLRETAFCVQKLLTGFLERFLVVATIKKVTKVGELF